MAATTDLSSYVKETYGKTNKLLWEENTLQRLCQFLPRPKVTDYYNEPVEAGYEHGFTRMGNAQEPALRPAVSQSADRAKVRPSQIVGRKRVAYREQWRHSEEDYASFTAENANRIEALSKGARRVVEMDLLHGQSSQGIGVVESVPSATTIKITAATFAPGLWAGSQGQPVNVFNSDKTTLVTSDVVVSSFDPDTRILTVTGTTGAIVAGDIITPDVQPVGSTGNGTPAAQMLGLHAVSGLSSGTLYNVNIATNYLYRPLQYSVGGGDLKMIHILKAAEKLLPKGVTGTLMCLHAPEHFATLNDDLAALRYMDGSYTSRKGVNGVEAIEFHYSRGKIILVSHLYQMPGYAMMFPFEENADPERRTISRIGSTDLTYMAKDSSGEIFFDLQDYAVKEMRIYTDQTLYVRQPGKVIQLNNIVPS